LKHSASSSWRKMAATKVDRCVARGGAITSSPRRPRYGQDAGVAEPGAVPAPPFAERPRPGPLRARAQDRDAERAEPGGSAGARGAGADLVGAKGALVLRWT